MDIQRKEVTCMDPLNLDVENIDDHLKSLILEYNTLMTQRKEDSCEKRDDELEFLCKLLNDVDNNNIKNIRMIMEIILLLDPSSMAKTAQHLLEKVLLSLDSNNISDEEKQLKLRVCNTILDTLIYNGEQVPIKYLILVTPLEYLLQWSDEKHKLYFVTKTLPKLLHGNTMEISKNKYELFFRLWGGVHTICYDDERKEIYLNMISCLFQSKKNVAGLIVYTEFWYIVLSSMWSNVSSIKEMSIYLFKRALLLLPPLGTLKQYSISFLRFNRKIPQKWITFSYKHCLEVLNDVNLYNQPRNVEKIKEYISRFLQNEQSILDFLRAIPRVSWFPVQFYHATTILVNLKLMKLHYNTIITDTIIRILKVPCANSFIKKAAHMNIAHFIRNCYVDIGWKDRIRIFTASGVYYYSQEYSELAHPFFSLIKDIELQTSEKNVFFENMLFGNLNLDILILYLRNHSEDNSIFDNVINKKINILHLSMNTQPEETDNLFITILMKLFDKTKNEVGNLYKVNEMIAKHNKIILEYLISLFSNTSLTNQKCLGLSEVKNFDTADESLEIIVLRLFSVSLSQFLKPDSLEKKLLSISVMRFLLSDHNRNILYKFNCGMIPLQTYLYVISSYNLDDTQSIGGRRLNYIFNRISCEILYILLENNDVTKSVKEIVHFLENALECGGYGCLELILKISRKIIKYLNGNNDFNLSRFLQRVWKELKKLKLNSEYNVCLKLFVDLIVDETILESHNNIVISYFTKIIETTPLKSARILKYKRLVDIFCEILLYCPVATDYERISENVTIDILQDPKYIMVKESLDTPFIYKIQYQSVDILCSIYDVDTLDFIRKFIINRINETLETEHNYSESSQLHRTLQTSLQHLLILLLKDRCKIDMLLNWCFDLLVKLPHQPSVRVSIEWIITLCFFITNSNIDVKMLQTLESRKVPLQSQLFILHWLLKRKISNSTYTQAEYDLVLAFLLSGTREHYNVHDNNTQNNLDIVTILQKLMDNVTKSKESEYFIYHFDIISNLTPYFVYHILPKYCVNSMEKVVAQYVIEITGSIERNLKDEYVGDTFIKEWLECQKYNKSFTEYHLITSYAYNTVKNTKSRVKKNSTNFRHR